MSRTKQGLLMLAVGVAAALSVGFQAGGGAADATEAYTLALRWTGRLAFFIFLIPFVASPLRTLVKNSFTAQLVRWRRNAGITYGGVQAVHIFFIAATMQASETNPFDTATLIVGGAGLALAIVMMLTSFDMPAKLLGLKVWKIVHRTGFSVMAFVYFVDFIVAPFELGFPPIYWLFMALTVGAFALRIAAWLKLRSASGSGAAVS